MSTNNTNRKKNTKFTVEEDEKLTHLIIDEKMTNWVKIASLMQGRNVRQCRERWRYVLCRRYATSEWSKEDEELLYKKYKQIGKKWARLQCFFPNHTLCQVKNKCKELIDEREPGHELLHPSKKKFEVFNPKPVEILETKISKEDEEVFNSIFESVIADGEGNAGVNIFDSTFDEFTCFW